MLVMADRPANYFVKLPAFMIWLTLKQRIQRMNIKNDAFDANNNQ